MSDEELIDGVYKLVMCIATGGSSQVWEVVEQPSGRHLAMKLNLWMAGIAPTTQRSLP